MTKPNLTNSFAALIDEVMLFNSYDERIQHLRDHIRDAIDIMIDTKNMKRKSEELGLEAIGVS